MRHSAAGWTTCNQELIDVSAYAMTSSMNLLRSSADSLLREIKIFIFVILPASSRNAVAQT